MNVHQRGPGDDTATILPEQMSSWVPHANTGFPLHKQQAASITSPRLNTLEID